jgi:superfamily II RNA helicase
MADDDRSTLLDHRPATADPDDVMSAFLEAMSDRGLELYAAQEEAILELATGRHVVLNTPTGSGKSLVALAAHFKALCEGKRSFYTCPIKALVSEKFFSLCDDLGPENVGMMTGDASINKDAPIICCTAEILANMALREGEHAAVDYVVMDEFHYYSDRDRGMAWQVPLLTLPQSTFMLMSATLGDVSDLVSTIEERTGRDVAVVRGTERPVPLDFTYSTEPMHETIHDLVGTRKSPIYVVNFTQRECAEQAQNLMSVNFSSKEEKQAIKDAVGGFKFDSPYGKDMRRYVMHGLGLHHAGLLPKYRLLVEQLSQRGLLKVISGTDTLGVGVNIPIRTVLFSKLCKYDGEKTGILSVRDFKQIGGRAGRKGFDEQGSVVAQAPDHVIENLKMERRYESDPKKKRKIVKKKPPERGYVHWDENTFNKLIERDPEPLKSRFSIDHGLLLNLLQFDDGANAGYRRLIELIERSHESDTDKSAHRRRAAVLFRALRGANLVDVEQTERGWEIVVSTELQRDFSLHHTLSLYLVEALEYLDPDDDEYALKVLTLVESILESPRIILLKQLDKLKGEKVAEMKAAGIEYEQRMEELDKLEHPKPERDFVYSTFNAFAAKHPWVDDENIRPKSIAREMYERYATFGEWTKELGLSRSEGVVLRYLSQTYKTLIQTVPAAAKTEAVHDIEAYLRTMLGRVDSSLVEEWESLLGGEEEEAAPTEAPRAFRLDPGADKRGFRARVRAQAHALVKALSLGDYDEAVTCVRADDDDPWTKQRFEESLAPFLEEHGRVVFDHRARQPGFCRIDEEGDGTFRVRQTLCDAAEHDEWFVEATITPNAIEDPDEPWLALLRIGA